MGNLHRITAGNDGHAWFFLLWNWPAILISSEIGLMASNSINPLLGYYRCHPEQFVLLLQPTRFFIAGIHHEGDQGVYAEF